MLTTSSALGAFLAKPAETRRLGDYGSAHAAEVMELLTCHLMVVHAGVVVPQ